MRSIFGYGKMPLGDTESCVARLVQACRWQVARGASRDLTSPANLFPHDGVYDMSSVRHAHEKWP